MSIADRTCAHVHTPPSDDLIDDGSCWECGAAADEFCLDGCGCPDCQDGEVHR